MTTTSDLLFAAVGSDQDVTIRDALATGGGTSVTVGTPTTLYEESGSGVPLEFTQIAADPAAGVYFVADAVNNGNEISNIYEEHFGQTPSFTTPLITVSSTSDVLSGMGIDASNNILYYSDGGTLYGAYFGSSFNNTPATIALATFPTVTAGNEQITPSAMAFDQADGTAYFNGQTGAINYNTSSTTGSINGNYIYKVSGLTKNHASVSVSSALGGANSAPNKVPLGDGLVSGMAVDSANDTLYFTTQPDTTYTGGTIEEGIYALALTGANAGHITTVWQQQYSAGSPFADMQQITVDPLTGDYYVTTDSNSGRGIYSGNINSSAAPVEVVADSSLPGSDGASYIQALTIIDPANVTGVAVQSIDGNTGVTTGTVGTADTVKIAVTFSESVTVSGTPTLALNDGGTATYVSGSGSGVLVFSYTPANGQNTATLSVTGLSGSVDDSTGTAANVSTATASFSNLRVDTTPPSLSVSGSSTDAVQGGASLTALAATPSITDPDGTGVLTGATVSITNFQTGDVLGINGATSGVLDSGAINFNASNGVLTLSGSASLAQYETALGEVTYQDTGTDGSTGSHPDRVLDWTIKEGALTSTVQTTTLAIDRPPVTAPGGVAAAVLEAGTLSLGAGSALAGDSDKDNDSLSVSGISGGSLGSPLSGTYGVLTLNADGSYNYDASNTAAIDAAPTGSAPEDVFQFTVSDGKGGFTTEALSITVERAVTLSGGGTTVTYAAGGTVIDSGLALTDPDAAMITGATVAITGGLLAGDELLFTDQNGINGVYTPGTGELVLTGSASAADYQTALDSIEFSSSSADASAGGTDTLRTVSFVVSDAAGASNAVDSNVVAICYLHGTSIGTADGVVNVEQLAIGDIVVTRREGLSRIKWIGRQSFAAPFIRNNRAKIPVRIRAGALGKGLPLRDLYVSPGHSMQLGERLVLARNLVNGVTITQDEVTADVHYVQVELERHDCLLAEGCWSESYADGPGLRAQFQNAAEFWALYPEYQTPDEVTTCLPRPLSGPDLAAALAPVVAQAATGRRFGALHGWVDQIEPSGKVTGWALDLASPELPLWLDIRLGGELLGSVLACDPREDVRQTGFGQGHCGFVFDCGRPLSAKQMGNIFVFRADYALLPRTLHCWSLLQKCAA